MTTLPNYPNLDQKSTGRNGLNNCVPTSIADGVEYLTGQTIDVAAMVATVKGTNYGGFTSASDFVEYVAQHGVRLWHIDGDGSFLVQAVHEQIRQGHPTAATEPDPYAADHPDWSHVISFYREDPGTLTARDPYSVHDVTHTDAEWAKLFEFHQVWSMEKIDDMAININSPDVSNYFEEVDAHTWVCKQTGKRIIYGNLAHYKSTNGIVTLGLPESNEVPIENIHPIFEKYKGKGIVAQYYERGVTVYDKEHLLDNPPGQSDVYRAHLYTSNAAGTDPRLWTMQSQISQLTTQLHAEQQKVAPPNPVVQEKLNQAEQLIQHIKQEVEAWRN